MSGRHLLEIQAFIGVLILKFMLKKQGGIYFGRIGPFNTVKKTFTVFCKMASLLNTLVSGIDQFFD